MAARKKAPELPPKRWTLTFVVVDSPNEGEAYFTSDEIFDIILSDDMPAGINVVDKNIREMTIYQLSTEEK